MPNLFDLDTSRTICGDALSVLEDIPDGSVQLCVTSPPYHIGKSYERGSGKNFDEYVEWITSSLRLVEAKLRDGGSLCLQVGSHVRNGKLLPLDYVFFPILQDLGLTFRNRIIWRYNFGFNAVKRLSGRYEVLLWFTKGDNYKFNLDPIRVPQLYPGKRHSASKGSKAGMPSGNPKGKNPSDYWEFDGHTAFFGEPVWNIPNVKANHPEKEPDHPCQFPNELVERCVMALTDEGDVVIDPFAGTGTTTICAHMHKRIGIGIEIDPSYASNAAKRLQSAEKGELPIRRSGQKPREPKATEKVANLPSEWLGENVRQINGGA